MAERALLECLQLPTGQDRHAIFLVLDKTMQGSNKNATYHFFFFGRRPLPFGGSPLEAYSRTSGESNHHRQSVRVVNNNKNAAYRVYRRIAPRSFEVILLPHFVARTFCGRLIEQHAHDTEYFDPCQDWPHPMEVMGTSLWFCNSCLFWETHKVAESY